MEQAPIKLGEGGRIVIPSEFRKALGVEVGDERLMHMENVGFLHMVLPLFNT